MNKKSEIAVDSAPSTGSKCVKCGHSGSVMKNGQCGRSLVADVPHAHPSPNARWEELHCGCHCEFPPTTGVGEGSELLPCPLCGSAPKIKPDSQVQRVNCRNRECGIFGICLLPKFWNRRASPATEQHNSVDEAKGTVAAEVVIPKYKMVSGAPDRYYMRGAAHPETVVRWFLALVHYWFDETLGPNLFTGMQNDAARYLAHWIATGEFAPDSTTLEIHTRIKFEEWLESSWSTADPTQPADDPKITTVPDALAPGTEVPEVPEVTSDVVPLNLRIENGGAWIPEVLQQVLIPANCGVSGHFQFQENGGHCMMCQRWDAAVGKLVEALRAAIADYYNLNATQFYLKYRTNDPLVAFDAAYEAASTGGKR